MEKIKKEFSLMLVMFFLCENIAFCVPEKYPTLRPPLIFSLQTEKAAKPEQKNNTPTLIDKLIAMQDEEITFSLSLEPEKTYEICIQKDFVSGGIFVGPNEKPLYMIYVKSVSDSRKDVPYPIGLATGIDIDEDGIIHLEWVSILDYPVILNEISEFRNELRQGTPLINAMALYFILGPKAEYYHYMKFLYAYLKARLDIKTDEAIAVFFKNAPKDLKGKGMANAILEFLTSFMPIGSKVKFKLANVESLESLDRGAEFEDTLIGKLLVRLGYEISEKSQGSSKEFPEFVLEKKRLPVLKTNWRNLTNLGGFVNTSGFVVSREIMQFL